jgi:hypothetical protein
LADLFLIPEGQGKVTKHVIFIHGLGGDPYRSWQSAPESQEGLLQWIANDIDGLAVWTVGYRASVSRWRGSAMHLTDRATNVLELLLLEPKLKTGEIILIGHSFGGLVIKQLLLDADMASYQRDNVARFLKNVHRVGFLATPHFGSGLSTLADRLRIFCMPSATTASLVRNDPNLHKLNTWYQDWSDRHRIEHLNLTETQPYKKFFLVVKPDSSNPGLRAHPIPVDANHITICKPIDRSSEIYKHIREFIQRELKTECREPEIESLLRTQGEAISSLKQTVIDQGEKTAESVAERIRAIGPISQPLFNRKYPKDLVDAEIIKRLSIIRRARFFREFSYVEHSLHLVGKIQNGEFEGGSDEVKSRALAWCARLFAVGDNSAKADELLETAKRLGNGQEITLAEAFIISAKGNLEGALNKLASLSSATAKSAAFFIVTNHKKNPSSALEWLSKSGITFSDLDPDGKFRHIDQLFGLNHWDAALEYVSELKEKDYQDAPVLYQTTAFAHLVKTVPDEIKSILLQQIPFNPKNYPLASDEASLKARRRAQELFQKLTFAAQELNCIETANLADDYALWLELRDPEHAKSGLQKLLSSMSDPTLSLRRLPLALDFGLNINLEAVEKEIDRQTAISGGESRVAALARFSLAFTQKSPKAIAEYVNRHRAQLQKYLTKQSINSLEIEMLVKAGMPQRAEERLMVLVADGLSDAEHDKLRRFIAESTEVDPIETQKAAFEGSRNFIDLQHLVHLLEEQPEEQMDWSQFCNYSTLLFEKTRALLDAERIAKALNAAHRFAELLALLKKYPEFLDQSDELLMLWSWALYCEGDLAGSTAALGKLQVKRDNPNDRALTVNLAITSGAWGSLLPYVEKEWQNREQRKTNELIQTAKLAQHVGSPHAKELIRFAANKGAEDPQILAAAYFTATSAGWEDETTTQWLNKAAELSGENGPIQRMSIKDLMNRKPAWDRRENDTWQQVNQGALPIFVAGQLLNRSLIDMILLPALANPTEPDLRKRVIIPAYSGARSPLPCTCRVAAMEATSLLTLSVLGLLEKVFDAFDRIVIPHSTLRWLFEEKQKASFHQPSKIQDARKLRQLLAGGSLREFRATVPMDADLSAEVGEDLACLLAEAKVEGDERQKVVVRSAPVHRVSSLMAEDADLSSFYNLICSCSSIVDKLKQKGQLTAIEEQRARSYLSLHEKKWPNEPSINDNAVLYLDSLSVTYLQHTGLLAKLKSAGLEVYISTRELEEINGVLQYEQLSSEVNEIIEALRSSLAWGIEQGRIKVGRMPQIDDAEEPRLRDHPTFAIYDLIADVEALIIDDRYFNQYQQFKTNEGSGEQIPLLTTLDLIDALQKKERDAISLDELREYRTRLRQSSYLFIPLTFDELQQYLSTAQVADSVLEETAELKAIRENLLRIRMSHFLQLPKETAWFNGLMQTIIKTLKAQWISTLDEKMIRARSGWLLQLIDVRGWAHFFGNERCQGMFNDIYGAHIMMLLTAPHNATTDIKNKYLNWVEEHVLTGIREEDPVLYARLLDGAKELIADFVERGLRRLSNSEH